MLRLISLCILFAISSASLLGRQHEHQNEYCLSHPAAEGCNLKYLNSICYPRNSTGGLDYGAPCNIQVAVEASCLFGKQTVPFEETGSYSGIFHTLDHEKLQSNISQRQCACESQFFESFEGCHACFHEHGNKDSVVLPSGYVSAMRSTYCAATATPTLGLAAFTYDWMKNASAAALRSTGAQTTNTASFTDPIGNKTAATLYYTAETFNTAALDVGKLTAGASTTTANVVHGQIVPTAGVTASPATTGKNSPTKGDKTASIQSTSGNSTSTGGSGARNTEAAMAGVIGLVGLVAML